MSIDVLRSSSLESRSVMNPCFSSEISQMGIVVFRSVDDFCHQGIGIISASYILLARGGFVGALVKIWSN